MQARKILPGLFLGLLFIGAFVFGLNSFGGTSSSNNKTSITQPTPADMVLPGEPTLVPGEVPIVVTTPAETQTVEVTSQTPKAAPVVEPTKNSEKGEQDSKEKEKEDDDDD